jgi:hypothetical protein
MYKLNSSEASYEVIMIIKMMITTQLLWIHRQPQLCYMQHTHTAVNFSFLDRSRYFFATAPQLSSRGWEDPVPDPLRLRKSGRAGNQTRDLWICSQKLWSVDHRGGLIFLSLHQKWPITVVARSKAWTVFAHSNIGIVDSNPTQSMDVYVRFFFCFWCCLV